MFHTAFYKSKRSRDNQRDNVFSAVANSESLKTSTDDLDPLVQLSQICVSTLFQFTLVNHMFQPCQALSSGLDSMTSIQELAELIYLTNRTLTLSHVPKPSEKEDVSEQEFSGYHPHSVNQLG